MIPGFTAKRIPIGLGCIERGPARSFQAHVTGVAPVEVSPVSLEGARRLFFHLTQDLSIQNSQLFAPRGAGPFLVFPGEILAVVEKQIFSRNHTQRPDQRRSEKFGGILWFPAGFLSIP